MLKLPPFPVGFNLFSFHIIWLKLYNRSVSYDLSVIKQVQYILHSTVLAGFLPVVAPTNLYDVLLIIMNPCVAQLVFLFVSTTSH